MRSNKHFIFLLIFNLLIFASGCTSLANIVVGKTGLRIPQLVANLEPFLKENKITVLGKIVIQNPTASDLGLDKIYLTIKGEGEEILGKDVLEWERPDVKSKQVLESPVKLSLSLGALNNKFISIFIRTTFTYKKLGVRIPIESEVAVLDLSALKETITRPLYVNIYSQIRTTLLGNASIDYVLSITNPLSIDLVLDEGAIRIFTLEGQDIAKSAFARTLFKGAQSNKIKGSLRIGNIFRKVIRQEFIRKQPLNIELSGRLRVPETDIFMPFKIESIQEIRFSLLGR
ncbi:MAG: hypothetical protein AMJ95_05345 [Omnitrophica WOR_2 bacterium SM23_72]|nr:MAG: hypothetical protein AMJ95_05345 [Omnitrophica WOR_2 bacterium SM23_72]